MDLMFEISISKMILFEKIGDESIFYGFFVQHICSKKLLIKQ